MMPLVFAWVLKAFGHVPTLQSANSVHRHWWSPLTIGNSKFHSPHKLPRKQVQTLEPNPWPLRIYQTDVVALSFPSGFNLSGLNLLQLVISNLIARITRTSRFRWQRVWNGMTSLELYFFPSPIPNPWKLSCNAHQWSIFQSQMASRCPELPFHLRTEGGWGAQDTWDEIGISIHSIRYQAWMSQQLCRRNGAIPFRCRNS